MIYKICKKLFNFLFNFVSAIQVTLVFLAFFTLLYWILDIIGVDFIKYFSPFFEGINSIVTFYYKRKVAFDEVEISFSYLITAISLLIFAGLLSFLKNFVRDMEKSFDEMVASAKSTYSMFFNKRMESQVLHKEKSVKKYMVLASFEFMENVNNLIKKTKEVDCEAYKMQRINDFAKSLAEKTGCRQSVSEGTALFYFENIDEVDKTLDTINELKQKVVSEGAAKKITARPYIAIEVLDDDKNAQNVFLTLRKLLALKLNDEIVCLGSFKMRYTLKQNNKYLLDTLGVYKVTHDEDDVFCLRDKATHERTF